MVQFRYASALDLLLMFLGSIAAIAHGASFPLLWLFLGSFVDVFISQSITVTVINSLQDMSNLTNIDCNTVFEFNNTMATVTDIIQQNFTQRYTCLFGDEFLGEINNITYAFIGIGIAAFIVAYVQIATFQTAAERQVYKIRLKYYRAVIRQNIAWFDANPTGEVATRLSEYVPAR